MKREKKNISIIQDSEDVFSAAPSIIFPSQNLPLNINPELKVIQKIISSLINTTQLHTTSPVCFIELAGRPFLCLRLFSLIKLINVINQKLIDASHTTHPLTQQKLHISNVVQGGIWLDVSRGCNFYCPYFQDVRCFLNGLNTRLCNFGNNNGWKTDCIIFQGFGNNISEQRFYCSRVYSFRPALPTSKAQNEELKIAHQFLCKIFSRLLRLKRIYA